MGEHNGAVCCCYSRPCPKDLSWVVSLFFSLLKKYSKFQLWSGKRWTNSQLEKVPKLLNFLFIPFYFLNIWGKNGLTTSCLWLSRILATMNENVAPEKEEEKRSLKPGPVYNLITTIKPLTPKSDKHLISPHNITSDSHIQATGIKEMIITYRSSWFLNKVSLSVP